MINQNIKVFDNSIAAILENQEGKIYQPLGKAFLMRAPKPLLEDLEALKVSNLKTGQDMKEKREIYSKKKKELEEQLAEMRKQIKL